MGDPAGKIDNIQHRRGNHTMSDTSDDTDNTPDGFRAVDPEPGRTSPIGEPVELLYEPEGCVLDFDGSDYTGIVVVLQTPSLYLIELRIETETGNTKFEKGYAANEARALAEQLLRGDAPKLTQFVGGVQNAETLGQYLKYGASMAGTLAIGEVAGDDTVDAFKEGKITTEEFLHEYGRNVDKMF